MAAIIAMMATTTINSGNENPDIEFCFFIGDLFEISVKVEQSSIVNATLANYVPINYILRIHVRMYL